MLFKNNTLVVLIFLFSSYQVYGETTAEKNTVDKPAPALQVKPKPAWVDNMHHSISNSVYQSAMWFDRFFIEDGDEQSAPEASARIKFGWEPRARDLGVLTQRFRVRVRLPHLQDKVDLIFSDDNDDDINQLPLDSPRTENQLDKESFSAAIRYQHKNERYFLTDSRIGITGGDIFVRTRHRRTYVLDDVRKFKVEPSIYYFLQDGLGARLLLEYDHQINDKRQNRVNFSTRVSESFSGVKINFGMYHLEHITDSGAAVSGFQIVGRVDSEQGSLIDNYILNYRYRFGALREWLFFEIEPFIEFPEVHNYKITPGIAFRIEGFFEKKK